MSFIRIDTIEDITALQQQEEAATSDTLEIIKWHCIFRFLISDTSQTA